MRPPPTYSRESPSPPRHVTWPDLLRAEPHLQHWDNEAEHAGRHVATCWWFSSFIVEYRPFLQDVDTAAGRLHVDPTEARRVAREHVLRIFQQESRSTRKEH